MDENRPEQTEEQEIDLQRLLATLWRKAWVIILTSIVAGVVAFATSFYLITPLYQSSALFYVNNSSLSVGDASLSISSGDISAAKTLVDSYIVILNSRTTLNDIIDYGGINRDYHELGSMISAAAVNGTEIFEVTVTSPDPVEAEKIANSAAYILPKRISTIIEGTSAQIVDTAVIASKPSSPNYAKNAVLGALLGMLLSAGIIVVHTIMDITVRTEEDIHQLASLPILAEVPDMKAPTKGGYYYSSDKKKNQESGKQTATVGGDISFAASEAYKLLRTKLQFSFTDDQKCRVIGVSSALAGEGKSLTSSNLAYTLSQLNKKVLLIDCDMRRPSLSEKLPIRNAPGLSAFLTGQNNMNELIQNCGLPGEETAFHVLAAGRIPPNPVELLSSTRMRDTIRALKNLYDYIILDLPPIGEVSDAIAISKEADGMLLVVRQNYCNRIALKDAISQFKFVGARILGVVFNGMTESPAQGYYSKKYAGKYGGRYAYSYAAADHKIKAEKKGKAR